MHTLSVHGLATAGVAANPETPFDGWRSIFIELCMAQNATIAKLVADLDAARGLLRFFWYDYYGTHFRRAVRRGRNQGN